jgi:dTDP-6-deoxy-L-talose 4-dehydrogenase (NAD+)
LILLTGATGFIGRQVYRALCARGAKVRVVIRTGSESRLAFATESVVATPDLFAEKAAWWTEACRGVDIVVHAAWYAEPGVYLHSPKNEACLAGTLELARGASAAKVRRFVGVGTCFEYDISDRPLTTQSPLRPLTPYAVAKVQAFRALSELLPSRGAFAWCRLFYLYGEGEDARRLVPTLRRRLAAGEPVDMTSGEQVRDFIDVAEAGALIADAASGDVTGPVNICSGVPITIRALAERIADEYGRRELLRFGARPDNAFDPPHIVGVR